STEFFQQSFIQTAQASSEYYASSIGSILDIIVPDYILKNTAKLKTVKNAQIQKNLHEKYAVQGDDEERYGTWKSLIRQEFARKRSVIFLFPTIEEAEYAFTLLEKGVEEYAFILHGSVPLKKIVETWNNIMKEPHPVVVITTGGFLSLPRGDVETIVVERESSRHYKIPRRPFLDIRQIAETLAEKKGIKIFFADNFLRLETLWRQGEGEVMDASPFKFRSLSTAKDFLADMRPNKTSLAQPRQGFKIFSEETERLVNRTRDESEHMMILATRRGTAPSTVCGDCQNIVTCSSCSAPVVLHSNFFLCHHCGERRSTEEYCKVCGSWKLGAIGIGIDLVEKKIKDKFPEISLFRIDSDTVNSDKTAHSIIQRYRAKPGSILLGTEMMLQYVHEKVENSAIISLDSLFSLPDFRIQEKILSILIRMRAMTARDFVVQTRKADEKVFEYGLKGNMSDFYRISMDERKKFNYPPFTVLVKLTLEGKKEVIVKEMEQAQTILEPYEAEIFPAFTHTIKGNFVLHGLIRLPKDKWVDASLVEKLRSLPPNVTVRVDPETLL
ncbi:MAG: hypothetical protein Q8Q03_00850, partial [bacterium]|nr:hypothetical protein [bacterium]